MSVIPTDRLTEEAVRGPVDPIGDAIARRRQQDRAEIESAIRQRQQRQAAFEVSPDEVAAWRARLPDVARNLTDSQVSNAVRFERQNPPKLRRFVPPRQAPVQALANVPTELAAGAQAGFWQAEANISEAWAVIFDTFGWKDMADEMRQASDNILSYHDSTQLGQVSREGPAFFVGELGAQAAPSALSLVGTGGASPLTLAYFAFQAAGAAGKEYDQMMTEQGRAPNEIDRFAIGEDRPRPDWSATWPPPAAQPR
ncbi:MAG: hypothetical protein ACYSVY_27045 [Planctomycetota bacterium]|jgi:hypothetical protein